MTERTRFDLSIADLPTAWFNIMPDLASVTRPLPPLDPGTLQPATPDLLAPLFPEALIMQEMSTEQWIDIPGPVIDIYRLWRPTPLHRARRGWSRRLQTPAHIYFKYEGTSPAGSHKPNTAVAQAYYNKEAGVRRLATETGAGQWGSALAMACRFFDLDCLVYMVRASYEQKPYRRTFMETFGAKVVPSPSDSTQAGRGDPEAASGLDGLPRHRDKRGRRGRCEDADTNYSIGSCLGHVLLHQTVIGLEAQKQMEMAGSARTS